MLPLSNTSSLIPYLEEEPQGYVGAMLTFVCFKGLVFTGKMLLDCYWNKKRVVHLEPLREESSPFINEKRLENAQLKERNDESQYKYEQLLAILDRYPDLKTLFERRCTEMEHELPPIGQLPPCELFEEGSVLAANSAEMRRAFYYLQLFNRIDTFVSSSPEFIHAVKAQLRDESDVERQNQLRIQFLPEGEV